MSGKNSEKSNRTLWWALGALAGALGGLYIWQRRQRQARLPALLEGTAARGKALVTGASSGLGEEYARQLARRGYDLLLLARREERLRTLAEELETRYGVTAAVVVADLADLDDIAGVVARIEALEDLELLINNAGFGIGQDFAATDPARIADMVRVHVLASMRFARAALPGMLARDRGAIVNVSSLIAYFPLGGQAAYSSTKVDLRAFSEALHQEVMGTGVRVQALCPGFTRTEMQEKGGVSPDILPGFAWLSSEYVVEQALRDLERGEVISIPGWGYKLLAFAERLTPRWLLYLAGRWLRARRKGDGGGDFSGFPKRTYGSFGEFRQDLRYFREHRDQIRRATALVPPDFRERLMLTVTQVNGCRYCAHQHAKLALAGGLSREEIDALLCGTFDGCPDEELTALLYAQHWADTAGNPDPETRARLVETYGAEKAQAIDVLLHMIKAGNYLGNAFDLFLYKISGGRWGV
ncbi:MAG: SDR family NAD(P)-dependent oxidoreductase [Anaerolineales bacterium]